MYQASGGGGGNPGRRGGASASLFLGRGSVLSACFSGPETRQRQLPRYLSVHFSQYLPCVSVCWALWEALGRQGGQRLALEGLPLSLGKPANRRANREPLGSLQLGAALQSRGSLSAKLLKHL